MSDYTQLASEKRLTLFGLCDSGLRENKHHAQLGRYKAGAPAGLSQW